MKLRNIIMIIIGAALIMPAFQSCKKGPNDPAISLRSRTARLCGDWDVTSAKVTNTSGTSTDTYTYEDGKVIITYSGGTSVTGTYDWTATFDKKGTFTMENTQIFSGNTSTVTKEGLWYFNDGNKDADVKAKEMLLLQPTSEIQSDGTTTQTYTYEGNYIIGYKIDQLKNKEIVLKYENTYNYGTTDKNVIEMTLTQKK